MCNDVSGIAVKRWKVRPHGLFAIGYREGSSPILRKTNVKVMLMSDYEMPYLKSPHFQVCARFRA